MSDFDKEIKEKQQKVKELFISMEIYFDKKITIEQKSEAENEQYRLEFKLKNLEIEGLDEKIKSYQKVLDILKDEIE
jgi:hypothetical protein